MLVEVESVLNSRPLTYVYEDEIEEPLTPSHLMIGRRLLSCNTTPKREGTSNSRTDLNKRAKYIRFLQEHFWNRWQKEYLTELRRFHRYAIGSNKSTSEAGVKEGDIVLVMDDKRPRNTWNLGRVRKMIKRTDGKARGAVVRVVGDNKPFSELRRSIECLVPVECNDKPVSISDVCTDKDTSVADSNEPCGGNEASSTSVVTNSRGNPKDRHFINIACIEQMFCLHWSLLLYS